MVPTALIYSIQFRFWPPQLHQHLHSHSTYHLRSRTYSLTLSWPNSWMDHDGTWQFDPIISFLSFTMCFAIWKISFWCLGSFRSLAHFFCFFFFAEEITLFALCLFFLYSFHSSFSNFLSSIFERPFVKRFTLCYPTIVLSSVCPLCL